MGDYIGVFDDSGEEKITDEFVGKTAVLNKPGDTQGYGGVIMKSKGVFWHSTPAVNTEIRYTKDITLDEE